MEYNLTFLEAVKALDEGRCNRIENTTGCRYAITSGIVNYISNNAISGIGLTPESFLDKWRLVDPKPVKHKKVIENVTWYRALQNGITFPTAAPGQTWAKFLNKLPMKMTLEWEE